MPSSLRSCFAAIFAAAVLAGCGSDREYPAPPTETARFVGENPFGVSEVDLAALKQALDLPADADPGEPPEGDAGLQLTSIARAAIPFCHSEVPLQPIDVAIRAAVDCSRIREAASPAGVGLWSLTVIRTDQPFEEIAESLVESGYLRRGRLLNYVEGSEPTRYAEVVAADGDQSLIALARDRTEAFAALGEGPADTAGRPDLAAIAALPAAPARTAWLTQADCIAAYALADMVEEGEGEMVVQLTEEAGDASSEGFSLTGHDGLAGGERAAETFDFGEPEAERSTLRIGFQTREGEARATGAVAAFSQLAFADPYECPPA